MKIHRNKFRFGWFTKLCDSTLYAEVKNITHDWKKVTCKHCLNLKGKKTK